MPEEKDENPGRENEKLPKDDALPHEVNEDVIHDIRPVGGLYEDWFLEYASYVILERAVPALDDGLKPVQRRILHAMNEMDDGRYNKVANIVGHSMQYHPHGDASIGDAIVNLGQKDLLIDTQGNWGDIRTGDSAAAPRYIEARLSPFAKEVVFNPQTTEWQLSYDGRKKEPVTLPVKFPLILAQGVDGIAVGLSTKILPHNFCELIQGSINILKNKKVEIYPDFPTGGMLDVSNYNSGQKGGRLRVRATIEELDKKTLVIKSIPYGSTTTGLIDSIIKANDQGKIKIKKVVDNTAAEVEIQVHLPANTSPDITIDALYAFTDCETSLSPNACVIVEEKPVFLPVEEMLRISTAKTVDLLKKELEIKRDSLMEKILFSSLEKIFIENRIYRDIEECETWEAVLETIDKGLDPYKEQFYREITQDDIIRLTEIRIKRISKFDTFKADEMLKKLQDELKETEHHLEHLIDFAVNYFQKLLDKYGKGKERKSEIRSFENIQATVVAAANEKLYVNRKEGFLGTSLKKDEYVCDCSDIDDIIVFREDGKFLVTKVGDKVFVGKNILYAGVFKKGDERMVYNMIYLDGKTGRSMVKRFQVLGVTRDREYDLTKGNKGSRALWFTANPNGEAEVVTVYLTSGSKAKKKVFEVDFTEVAIKGRGSQGNIVTKYPVRKVELKEKGKSTLGGLDIWYDEAVGRLNTDERGRYLGKFESEDQILVIYKEGEYEITNHDLTNRYEPESVVLIQKFNPDRVVSAVYYDGGSKTWYVKRFNIETTSTGKRFGFISDSKGSYLYIASTASKPVVQVDYKKGKYVQVPSEKVDLSDFIDIKGWKAIGNKLTNEKVRKMEIVEEKDEDASTAPGTSGEGTGSEQSSGSEEDQTAKKKDNEITKGGDSRSGSSGNYDVGSSIDLDVKPKGKDEEDQLGLF